jgi:hypothetical protein
LEEEEALPPAVGDGVTADAGVFKLFFRMLLAGVPKLVSLILAVDAVTLSGEEAMTLLPPFLNHETLPTTGEVTAVPAALLLATLLSSSPKLKTLLLRRFFLLVTAALMMNYPVN